MVLHPCAAYPCSGTLPAPCRAASLPVQRAVGAQPRSRRRGTELLAISRAVLLTGILSKQNPVRSVRNIDFPKWRAVQNDGKQYRKLRDETRRGFKVNEKYKGAKSYGSVDEDDFAEAERIRNMWSQDISAQREAATKKIADARRRLLRQRLRQNQPWSLPETGDAGGVEAETVSAEEAQAMDEGAAGDAHRDEELQSADAAEVAGPPAASRADAGGVAARTAGASFPGMADSGMRSAPRVSAAAPREAAVPLSLAERLAGDEAALRGAPGPQLMGASSVLSAAGRHVEAAAVLRHLRDFGVERDVLLRRLPLREADALFHEASLRLGLELQRAGLLPEAWAALTQACAEPGLREPRPAVAALADVALRLAMQCYQSPARQVEVLQSAVDSAAVWRSLARDKKDELELSLALALQAAGRPGECRSLLEALSRGAASQRRRQQAEWALLVQSADVGGGPAASAKEFRSLWDEAAPGRTAGLGAAGASGSAAAAAMRGRGRTGSSAGLRLGGLGVLPVLLVLGVLGLPLAVPFIAWLKNSGSA